MSSRIATLIGIAAIALMAVLGYVVSEVRLARAQTERAVVEMDSWLRLASKLAGHQAHSSVRDLIDLNLDGALALIILNRRRGISDEELQRQVDEKLAGLHKYWSALPPYAGPQWEALRVSPAWREALESRMAFLQARVAERGRRSPSKGSN